MIKTLFALLVFAAFSWATVKVLAGLVVLEQMNDKDKR